MEGHWKFQGGEGSQQPRFIRESMKLDWEFQGGWEGSNKRTFHGAMEGHTIHFFLLSTKCMCLLVFALACLGGGREASVLEEFV